MIDAPCFLVRRTLGAKIKIQVQFAGNNDAESGRIDQHSLICAFAPVLPIVLVGMIDVIAPRKSLYVPVSAHGLIGAYQVGNAARVEFKPAVHGDRRAGSMNSIKAITQSREPA